MKPAKKSSHNSSHNELSNESSDQACASSQLQFGSQSVNRLAFKSLDCDEISNDMLPNDEDVMKLMQERLPSYVVNCFVSSGFDSTEAICCMNVTDDTNNSIKEIENYIENHCNTDIKLVCRRSDSVSDSVDSRMESPDETVSSVSNQICCSVSSWVKKQSDGTLQGLKENQHFQITVQTLKLSDRVSATIKCMPCNTTLQLQRNPKIPS